MPREGFMTSESISYSSTTASGYSVGEGTTVPSPVFASAEAFARSDLRRAFTQALEVLDADDILEIFVRCLRRSQPAR